MTGKWRRCEGGGTKKTTEKIDGTQRVGVTEQEPGKGGESRTGET